MRLLRFAIVCMVSLATVLSAMETAHHTLIQLYPQSKAQEEQLSTLGLDLVAAEQPGDLWAAALPGDLELLRSEGISYEVLMLDMEEYFARRAAREGHLDDMGGYKTFSEIEAALDQIHADHPTITTAKFSIGSSLLGNPLWCMKISDNPETDEGEIELLYTSLTHAREPAAMEALFVFFDSLTTRYSPGSGNESTYLVDNREFYWIPCVNPDGYLYNEQTDPGGGGMWRKNRRNNGDGSFGIDLNRNFGVNWGADDEGSSPIPSSDLYRGTGPFSEPETQAYRDFVNGRNFLTAMNYHTYSNLILYPWGSPDYLGGYTPEDDVFSFMADSMAYYIQQVNGANYTTGTAWDVLYSVNGDANDWCYGEQSTKPRIFSFTTEIGSVSDNFWPAPSRIVPLALENLPSNYFVARYAEQLVPPDQWADLEGFLFSEAPGDGDEVIESGEDIALDVSLQNAGGLDLVGLTGTLSSASPFVTITNDEVAWSNLIPGATEAGLSQFSATIMAGVPEPFGIDFTLHVSATSGLDTIFALSLVVGPPILDEDFETSAPEWTHEAGDGWGDQWHLSTEMAHEGSFSYKCGSSGTGNHAGNLDARLISPAIVDLPEEALLAFWSNVTAERSGLYQDSAYDGGLIEIAVDGGPFTPISPVEGYTHTFRYTVGGSAPYQGPMPGYPCFSGTSGWQRYTVDLSAYAGSDVQIRFRFGSDASINYEGWYVDEVMISGVRPVTLLPPSGLTVAAVGGDLILRWNDDINPAYVIYSDADPDGPFETFVGSTTGNEYTIVNGIDSEQRFYVVIGTLTIE